ncbi:RNase adapter RapZ [Pseudoglutamicibacter cumminsii]|uniref:RNase adapter RapZ n=1 Tax=Pseudoglutamicibacter cumminsii TaxID=156979 RepID=UPI0021A96D8B|nr:RNase adapter RapZ [Pseudoglutamicibacter cumminsii]MCT1685951.1 RNase adapter RapZ [Pseudoglutamicibacter cumminsii]
MQIEQPAEVPQKNTIVVMTGMSGAGRTTAGHALEDMGWYVVDNLPPQMLQTLVDVLSKSRSREFRIAVGINVRSEQVLEDLTSTLAQMDTDGIEYQMLFIDCDDATLVRRFEQGRRPHPLQGSGRIVDGIEAERALTEGLRERSDFTLDTTTMNVHDLSRSVHHLFNEQGPVVLTLNVISFGFKYGVPMDANFMADVRFVPNPHWIPELRPLTGQDSEVSEYVLGAEGTGTFVDHYVAALESVFDGYRRERKHYATIAIGCTGGKHRSVAIATEVARRLDEDPHLKVVLSHRDLGRE